MWETVYWLYLVNAVLIINHEIDSAYWREWNLFMPAGKPASGNDEQRFMSGFLIVHVPVLVLILMGLVEVYKASFSGLVLSLILAAGGLFAFTFHTIMMRRGRPGFNTPVSKLLLVATLAVSLAQGAVAVWLILGY